MKFDPNKKYVMPRANDNDMDLKLAEFTFIREIGDENDLLHGYIFRLHFDGNDEYEAFDKEEELSELFAMYLEEKEG